MTINEFYEKHKGKTTLKIAQMNELERFRRTHNNIEWENLIVELKYLYVITREEYIDLGNLQA